MKATGPISHFYNLGAKLYSAPLFGVPLGPHPVFRTRCVSERRIEVSLISLQLLNKGSALTALINTTRAAAHVIPGHLLIFGRNNKTLAGNRVSRGETPHTRFLSAAATPECCDGLYLRQELTVPRTSVYHFTAAETRDSFSSG